MVFVGIPELEVHSGRVMLPIAVDIMLRYERTTHPYLLWSSQLSYSQLRGINYQGNFDRAFSQLLIVSLLILRGLRFKCLLKTLLGCKEKSLLL